MFTWAEITLEVKRLRTVFLLFCGKVDLLLMRLCGQFLILHLQLDLLESEFEALQEEYNMLGLLARLCMCAVTRYGSMLSAGAISSTNWR